MTQDHEHHEHEHDDHDDPFHVHATTELNIDELDPANRSLAEALRISFGLLKGVVLVLLVAFFVVGSYRRIDEGQVGLRTRFGALQGQWKGEGTNRHYVPEVLTPGAHFAWPEPIESILIVPTKTQTVLIGRGWWFDMQGRKHADTGFWFQPNPNDVGKPLDKQVPQSGGLQPGRDGSLLTADKNLMHGKWSVNYRIKPDDAPRFAMTLGTTDITQSLQMAATAVRLTSEMAIVQVVAQTTADDFWQKNIDRDRIRRIAQQALDAINSGITIDEVQFTDATPPLAVRAAFSAVNEALSEKNRKIDEAERDAEKTQTEAAGRAYQAMVPLLDYYARASRAKDQQRIHRGWRAINALISGKPVAEALRNVQGDDHFNQTLLQDLDQRIGEVPVGGEVAEMIRTAESDKTNIRSAVQAEANAFLSYYNRYAERQPDGTVKIDHTLRQIIIERLWQDTMQTIFSSKGIETIILPPQDNETLYLEIGRNPKLRQLREQEKRKQNIEAGRKPQSSP